MTSPIGFIINGKKIRVGEKAKNKGRVLPTVVNRRVVYIKISDLQTSNKLTNIESVSARLKTSREMSDISKRLSFGGSIFFANTSSPDFSGESDDVFLGFFIKGYFENSSSKQKYTSSLEYSTFSEKRNDVNFSFSYINIPFSFSNELISSGRFELNYLYGVSILPFVEYKNGGDFTLNGYGLGANFGTEIVFKISKALFIHLEGNYQYLYTTGFNFPNINDFPSNASFILSGIQTTASISYGF